MSTGLADYQNELYLAAANGSPPSLPVDPAGMRALARERMTDQAWAYVEGGAGAEDTVLANAEALRRRRILPRMLGGVATRDLATTVLGTRLPAPVLLGPVGVTEIIHPDAERAVARASRRTGVPMVLSTAASTPLEDVAAELGDTPRWFQLYWPKSRELTASLLQRAEAAGYSAVAVTLDTFLLGWRPRDLNTGYLPFLQGKGIANYTSDPVFRSMLAAPPERDPAAAVALWAALFSDPGLTWADLDFLRECTRLPLLLKGICRADDARRAVDAGVEGLVVSNHGGRQVDGAMGALDQLEPVVAAVDGRAAVLFDSGVRSGADAVKALALGAQAVLLGRLWAYGLGAAGEAGVVQVVRSFLAELDLTLANTGHRSPADLRPDLLAAAP